MVATRKHPCSFHKLMFRSFPLSLTRASSHLLFEFSLCVFPIFTHNLLYGCLARFFFLLQKSCDVVALIGAHIFWSYPPVFVALFQVHKKHNNSNTLYCDLARSNPIFRASSYKLFHLSHSQLETFLSERVRAFILARGIENHSHLADGQLFLGLNGNNLAGTHVISGGANVLAVVVGAKTLKITTFSSGKRIAIVSFVGKCPHLHREKGENLQWKTVKSPPFSPLKILHTDSFEG